MGENETGQKIESNGKKLKKGKNQRKIVNRGEKKPIEKMQFQIHGNDRSRESSLRLWLFFFGYLFRILRGRGGTEGDALGR